MNEDHIAKAAEAVVRQQEGRALSFDDVTEIAAARDEIAKAPGRKKPHDNVCDWR